MISIFGTHHEPSPTNGIRGSALADSSGELVEETKKRLAEVEELVRDVVTTRPALALGAALAAGVVIGWLIKRR